MTEALAGGSFGGVGNNGGGNGTAQSTPRTSLGHAGVNNLSTVVRGNVNGANVPSNANPPAAHSSRTSHSRKASFGVTALDRKLILSGNNNTNSPSVPNSGDADGNPHQSRLKRLSITRARSNSMLNGSAASNHALVAAGVVIHTSVGGQRTSGTGLGVQDSKHHLQSMLTEPRVSYSSHATAITTQTQTNTQKLSESSDHSPVRAVNNTQVVGLNGSSFLLEVERKVELSQSISSDLNPTLLQFQQQSRSSLDGVMVLGGLGVSVQGVGSGGVGQSSGPRFSGSEKVPRLSQSQMQDSTFDASVTVSRPSTGNGMTTENVLAPAELNNHFAEAHQKAHRLSSSQNKANVELVHDYQNLHYTKASPSPREHQQSHLNSHTLVQPYMEDMANDNNQRESDHHLGRSEPQITNEAATANHLSTSSVSSQLHQPIQGVSQIQSISLSSDGLHSANSWMSLHPNGSNSSSVSQLDSMYLPLPSGSSSQNGSALSPPTAIAGLTVSLTTSSRSASDGQTRTVTTHTDGGMNTQINIRSASSFSSSSTSSFFPSPRSPHQIHDSEDHSTSFLSPFTSQARLSLPTMIQPRALSPVNSVISSSNVRNESSVNDD